MLQHICTIHLAPKLQLLNSPFAKLDEFVGTTWEVKDQVRSPHVVGERISEEITRGVTITLVFAYISFLSKPDQFAKVINLSD